MIVVERLHSLHTTKEKLKMKKMIRLFAVVLLIACVLTGCMAKTKETVATDGSTSMNKVIGALGEAFEADTGIFVSNPFNIF